jgi:3-deoxy-D-manno-octulosonic-acid transferase
MSASLWLYRLLLHGLLPVVGPALWLEARLRGKARPPFASRLARQAPAVDPGALWCQAVSVGEVELARRLVAEIERRAPDLPLLVTATTATGLALAKRTLGERLPVDVCPVDLPGPVARMLDALRPRAVVLVETELWPELLHQSARRGVPVAVVNARLSDGSFRRYRRLGSLLRPLLEPASLVLAQSQADADRFATLGVAEERIRVAGNIKYDLEPPEQTLPWEEAAQGWAEGRGIVVAGSTMEGEEEQVVEALERLGENMPKPLLVLAPRHPERFDGVARQLSERGLAVVRRSRMEEAPERVDVFVIDTIGELGRAYALGTVAFVGGSLVPTGGHNPLEPAVFGVPVLTGPHVHNFRQVYDQLCAAGGAVVVEDSRSLAASFEHWLAEPDAAAAAGAAGKAVVEANRGATARTAEALLELIDLESISESEPST